MRSQRFPWKMVGTIGLILGLSSGCGRSLVEFREVPISQPTLTPLTLEQVATGIQMGGEKSGWQMTYLNPGEVIGNFTSRRYSAAVFIPFSTRAYSIFYKASRGLDYEENDIIFGEKIHKKYNQLVEALKHSIGNELIMPPPAIHVEESTAPPASTPSAKEEYQEPLDMEDLAKWLRRKERESQNASDSSSTPSP